MFAALPYINVLLSHACILNYVLITGPQKVTSAFDWAPPGNIR